jgi:putative membrane protein
MKKVKFLLLIAVIGVSQACNNSGNKDSVEAAKDSNNNTMASHDSSGAMMGRDTAAAASTATATPVGKDDADFAVEAADGGMMEVDLGNYAQQNALNPRVKEFGAMMVRDHSKANDELKSIAATRNVALPTATSDKHKKKMDDLMKKKGKDFDKAYMDMMVDDHKEDVKKFEKASNECKEPTIKAFAAKTLPILRTHLDSAKAIAGKR